MQIKGRALCNTIFNYKKVKEVTDVETKMLNKADHLVKKFR